jgi:hypothetical protein
VGILMSHLPSVKEVGGVTVIGGGTYTATKTLQVKAAPTKTKTVSNVALTGNVATLTTSAEHGFIVGESVAISGLTNTFFNGTYAITSTPSTTTFTYALTHANFTSAADSGTVTVSQTANIVEWQDGVGTTVASVSPAGYIALQVNNVSANPLSISNIADGYTTVRISNATHSGMDFGLSPTGVSSHFYIYSLRTGSPLMTLDDFGKMWVGVDSSITQMAPSQLFVSANSASTKGIISRGFTSQSANLLECQNSIGTPIFLVAANGCPSAPDGTNSERFGSGASATGSNAVSIGKNAASTGSDNSVLIGGGSSLSVGSHNSVVVGANLSVVSDHTTAVGTGMTGSIGGFCAVVGNGIAAGCANAVAIGYGASVTGGSNGTIAIGNGATTTAAGQIVFDSTAFGLTDAYWGGVTKVSPVGFTQHATGGSGANVAGANYTVAGGQGTGTGIGGSFIVQTSAAGSTGSTLNGLTTRLTIDSTGLATFTGTVVAPAFVAAIASKSAGYTLTSSDSVVLGDATSAGFTVTLPNATTAGNGREYTVKKIDSSANAVTIGTTASQTIDGASTVVISVQYDSITVVAFSGAWYIK